MASDREIAQREKDAVSKSARRAVTADFILGKALIYRLRTQQDALHHQLRRLGPPTPHTLPRGELIVQTIESLRRSEHTARSLVPFDPSGL